MGKRGGHLAFILQIPLLSESVGLPYSVRYKQFPICLAYAMTNNKFQGQTLTKIRVCLTKNIFIHRQLYVAFSRAMPSENVSVLLAT